MSKNDQEEGGDTEPMSKRYRLIVADRDYHKLNLTFSDFDTEEEAINAMIEEFKLTVEYSCLNDSPYLNEELSKILNTIKTEKKYDQMWITEVSDTITLDDQMLTNLGF